MFEAMTTFAVQRKAWMLAITALFCVFGWSRLMALPIEAFPDVTDPMVEVVGLYPGQAAEEVERKVTLELERVLAGVAGLHDLRSVSVFGLALVTLTFDEGIPDFNLRQLVSERLRDASLPEGAETIMGPQATPVGQIYRYTVRGPRTLRDLRALQDFVIERRLRSVPGVADIVTFGGFERQYQIRIETARLAAAGVSIAELHAAIARANENAGGGYVGVGSQEFIVRGIGTAQRAEELGLSVIRTVGGVAVRVRDVADIVEGSTPRRGAVGRGHNSEVVEGIVLLRRGENPSVVLEALHAKVRQLNDEVLPKDVRIAPFYDRSALVDATLSTVGKNMLEGIALVMAVVYLFLNTWRALVIVACVVPVSLLTAFVALSCKGLPANLISLGAIDFGILVDGAIIVIESTLHGMAYAANANPPDASALEAHVRRGAARVAKPVAFAMGIIIIALLPIFALERVEGRIFAPMAFTYAFALVGALLCAVFVVPALEAYVLRGRLQLQEARWLTHAAKGYTRLLAVCRRHKGLVFGAFAALALALTGFGAGIGTEFLPELNEGGFYITSTFPSTIALDEAHKHVDAIRERILRTPEVTDVMSHLGRPESATQAEGPNNAEFFVMLAPESSWRVGVGRKQLEHELRERLADIPGVAHNFSQPITDRVFETISGIIGQVVVKVRGDDLEALTQVAEQVRESLSGVTGITDLSIYQAGTVPAMEINIDRDALARRGVSVEDVQQAIRLGLGDEVATHVWQQSQHFAVVLRLPAASRASPDALGHLVLNPDTGLTLGEVAHITTRQSRSSIWREDFSRFVAVKFNVRGRDLGGTVQEGQAKLQTLTLPEGTYLSWGGEFQNQHRAMRRLAVALPLALLAIAGVLYLNFRHWYPTALIVSFLPLACAGAIAGLRLLGENFSVSSAVGCIALLGQVVLAGVTVCARIDSARQSGAADALVAGAREAFRPVLLTTVLALLGLLPAAMSHAMGSETQRPFAIAVVAGLFIVTPALLLLLPLLYAGRQPVQTVLARAPAQNPHLRGRVAKLGRVARTMVWAAAVLLPAGAAAQTQTQTFTLAQAQDLLHAGHPRLESARHMEQAAQKDAITAGLWENPQISLDYFKGVNTSSYDPLGVGILRVSQMLELSGVPPARRAAARALQDAATAEREATAMALELDVEEAYVQLAADSFRVARIAERLEQVTWAQTIVDARVQAGDMSRYGARRIAVAKAVAAADLKGARAAQALSRARLNVAVGPLADQLQGTAVMPAGDLPQLHDAGSLTIQAQSQRRDIVAAQAQTQSAKWDVRVAKRSVFPGVNLGLMAGYGQATHQWDVGATLSLPLPVVDRGQSTIPAARARQHAAQSAQEALALQAGRDIAAAWQAATLTYQALAQFVSETQSIETSMVQEAEAQFKEARLTVLEWVDAIAAAQDVSVRRVELGRDARLAELRLRRLVSVSGAS